MESIRFSIIGKNDMVQIGSRHVRMWPINEELIFPGILRTGLTLMLLVVANLVFTK